MRQVCRRRWVPKLPPLYLLKAFRYSRCQVTPKKAALHPRTGVPFASFWALRAPMTPVFSDLICISKWLVMAFWMLRSLLRGLGRRCEGDAGRQYATRHHALLIAWLMFLVFPGGSAQPGNSTALQKVCNSL